jgi:hypothetical protein
MKLYNSSMDNILVHVKVHTHLHLISSFAHVELILHTLAVYRLLKFPTNERYPPIQRLSIHTDGEHDVYFGDQAELEKQMLSRAAARTTLTEFF